MGSPWEGCGPWAQGLALGSTQFDSVCDPLWAGTISVHIVIPPLHFLQMVCSLLFSSSVMSDSLRPHGLQHARLLCPSLSLRVCTNSCWLSGWCIQPSRPLLYPCPPAFNFSQHQCLFQRFSSSHQVAKVLELQLQHQSFQWVFRVDCL